MSRYIPNASEMGRRGGNKNKETKPKEYWAEIGAKGRASILRSDPDFFLRLAASGLYAREVKKQAWIKAQIDDSNPVQALSSLLTGK